MKILKSVYSWFRQRIPEVYFRFRHAGSIFSKRFFTLSVSGHIDLESEFGFNESKAIDRGNKAPDGLYYSRYHTVDWVDVPPSIKQAIKNYESVLRMFLGDGYLVNDGLVWRNHAIPEAYRNTELFSQNWHYDKVVDFRNVQLFVLLSDVTADDGPVRVRRQSGRKQAPALGNGQEQQGLKPDRAQAHGQARRHTTFFNGLDAASRWYSG